MRKNAIVIAAIVASLCFLADGVHAGDLLKRVSLKLSPGFRSLMLKDLDGLEQNLDPELIQAPLNSGFTRTGDVKGLSMGIDYLAELLVTPARNFDIGIEVGAFRFGKQSQILMTNDDVTMEILIRPRLIVIPLAFSLYYHLPITSSFRMNTYVFAGGDYSFATMDWSLSSEDFGREVQFQAKSRGLGFHGGLGYEFQVISPLSLFAEFVGKVCSLKYWRGEAIRTADGAEISSDGNLWKYEEKNEESGNWYTKVDFSAEEPSADTVRKVGRFAGSLTGISVRMWVRFRL